MRITKATKTSVKASIKVGDQVYIEPVSDKLPRKFGTVESIDGDNVCIRDRNDSSITYNPNIGKVHKLDIDACGDIKASTQSSIIYDKKGIVVKKTGRNYDFIAIIENNTDDVFCINTYDPSCDDVDECNVVVNPHGWIGILADDEGYAIVEYFEKLGGIVASKKLSTTDKALQHIKAAIDILGKSGDKDEVTKDSIANLGVVMFDLKSKK